MLQSSSETSGMTPLERTAVDEIMVKLKSFGGKCHCPDVDVMDKRLLALETQIRGVLASGAPPPGPMVRGYRPQARAAGHSQPVLGAVEPEGFLDTLLAFLEETCRAASASPVAAMEHATAHTSQN
jgi:hypothetical protein